MHDLRGLAEKEIKVSFLKKGWNWHTFVASKDSSMDEYDTKAKMSFQYTSAGNFHDHLV